MLTIGTKVLVSSLAYWYYDGKNRKWKKTLLENPQEAFYVGYTYKYEGEYQGAKYRGTFDGYNEDPPYLEVTNSVKLYRVKFTDRSNDHFAFPEDVREIYTINKIKLLELSKTSEVFDIGYVLVDD